MPRTAVVPAAGLGTRFLPATKTVPKELLPVVDTPGIELVAAEAAEAGAERLVIITSEGKDGVVAHFVEDLVLEGTLEKRGKHVMLEKVRRAAALIKVESVVQAEPLGLGHAVSCVESVLTDDDDAIAVLLPDDLVLPTGVLETMSKVPRRDEPTGSVLAPLQRLRYAAGVAAGDGEQHPHGAVTEVLDPLDRAGFGPDRHISADGRGPGDQRREVAGERMCLADALLRRYLAASPQYRRAQLGFRSLHRTASKHRVLGG